jgi:hypothetical protein
MGAAVRRVTVVALLLLLGMPAAASAAERFALLVSGASGGERYATLQQQWRQDLASVLKGQFAIPDANIVILDEAGVAASRSTAENVRRVLGDLRRRMTGDDILLVVLFGHGTIDGVDAKFNLVGPDLTAVEWRTLFEPIAGRLVVVNTTESSFPFIEELSRKDRVVITATDSTAQRFATVFPEYFVRSLVDPSSDSDKDGRISLWEAFSNASAAVKLHYEQRGQLSTERPLLDDDGDRVGQEFQAPGSDGALARRLFLDPERSASAGDAALADLHRTRDELQRKVEELKARKPLLADEQYQAEMEALLVQLARVSARIRSRS